MDAIGTDEGMWRRIRLIPFTVVITQKDRRLPEKLRAEAEGILAFMIRGAVRWLRHGLGEPAEVVNATAAYRSESDTVAMFLEQACVTGPDCRESAGSLYERYRTWCASEGEEALSQKQFGSRLAAAGFSKARSGPAGQTVYRGLQLRRGH
jgi:putative DNA primase/helicase